MGYDDEWLSTQADTVFGRHLSDVQAMKGIPNTRVDFPLSARASDTEITVAGGLEKKEPPKAVEPSPIVEPPVASTTEKEESPARDDDVDTELTSKAIVDAVKTLGKDFKASAPDKQEMRKIICGDVDASRNRIDFALITAIIILSIMVIMKK